MFRLTEDGRVQAGDPDGIQPEHDSSGIQEYDVDLDDRVVPSSTLTVTLSGEYSCSTLSCGFFPAMSSFFRFRLTLHHNVISRQDLHCTCIIQARLGKSCIRKYLLAWLFPVWSFF
jgi:hypothetical protein